MVQTSRGSVREVLVNSYPTTGPTMSILGRPFLTSTYFIVDQDKQHFSLSKVNATSDHILVSGRPPSCNRTSSLATPTSGASGNGRVSTGASSTSEPTASVVPPRHRLSHGAIAGTVTGGVVVVALCFGVFVFSRYLRRTDAQPLTVPVADVHENCDTGTKYAESEAKPYKVEVPTDFKYEPSMQMLLERHPLHQPAPYELS